MSESSGGSRTANVVAHAVNYVRNTVELAANVAMQNYVGAGANLVQLLPYLVAIKLFIIIAPTVIFLAMPAMVLENFNPILGARNGVGESFVRDGIFDVYGEHMRKFSEQILDLESRFRGGSLDSLLERDYSRFVNPRLDIWRSVAANSVMTDIVWFAVLHSIYFGNDPANMTISGTAEFIAGFFTYRVSEQITDIIAATRRNPVTLMITRRLEIEFREPLQIMRFFGFDDQQIMWAQFMHTVIWGDLRGSAGEGSPTANPDALLSCPILNWQNHVTSEFGNRRDPFGSDSSEFHRGIDIARPTGTSIFAAADGVVVRADWFGRYGNTVIIDHGGGVETLYAHCDTILVFDGQEVRQGEVIATVGSTGRSTGAHLHFEVRVNGVAENPRVYL
jgi:hypothetical protein